MGNIPSVEAPRRPGHKLSKPRTGNFTTAGLLGPNGYSNSTARFSANSGLPAAPLSYPSSPVTSPSAPPPSELGGNATNDHDSEDRGFLAPADVKQQRRRSLFRSKSSQGAVERRNQRRNTIIGTTTPTTTDSSFPSRANSMTYESMTSEYYGRTFPENLPPAGSRTSWTYDLTSYEAKRLLNLVEEPVPALHRSSTVSEMPLEAVSEVTWKSSNPARPESTPISRANSDLSLYAPMRRRSIIQTPGVATRTRPPTSSRPSFRHSVPATPSLSRQASFESYSSRILSMPPPRLADSEDVPRVVTPCEGDYKAIGAFRLGSLRITNGSPVRTPEVARTRKVEEPKIGLSREDYFSAGEILGLGITSDAKPSGIRDKPLPRIQIPKALPASLSPVAASFMNADEVASSSSPKGLSINRLEAQGEYLTEMSFSPFSLDAKSPTSPQLQTTSKHTAVEDQLFEVEDDSQLEYSAVEVLEVRLDLNAKSLPPRPLANPSQKTTGNVTRSDSGFVSTSPTSESSHSHRPLAKADSGYSSNVSLRSFHGAATKPAVPEKDYQEVGSPTSISSGRFYSSPPQREPPPPPLPPKDQSPASPTMQHVSRDSFSSITRKPVRHTPSPINSMRSSGTGPKSPDSIPLTPASAKSDASNSALSIGSVSRKPGKLQRLLSLSHYAGLSKTPLTVHVTHAVDKSIPSVPHEVQARLHEHTGLFPMTTKRLALKTQLSKETLKTIFSVGSLEITKDDPLPPLPTLPDDEKEIIVEVKESHLKLAVKSVPSTIVHAAASVIPRKPIARKPVPTRKQLETAGPQKQADPEQILAAEAELTTYTSINNSLGNNAYDAAFKAIVDEIEMASPRSIPGRAMSMTAQMERTLDAKTYSLNDKSSDVQDEPAFATARVPFVKDLFPPGKQKTPPPVAMRTQRRPTSLRVPPPLRSQSTPPGALSLSRKASRESIHSYPAAVNSAAPPIPPMNPRRSMEFQRQQSLPISQYRTPNWEVQTDHDPLGSSRRSFIDQSRRSSMSSSSGQREFIKRPTSAQPYAHRPNAPPLRHRASYDGYNHSQAKGYAQPAPNQGPRPQTQFDPWNDPQFNLEEQQWEQSGRYPRSVPRGHHRNRSVGGYGHHAGNPPYRILHSYNSPAYRNVPIWG